ncbi:MAG: antibiotic biosynthesis monooxygenase [Luminiphilus sp.]|nr:antibiotic biosynthesis monooxygenase [Luminiphilus sp.]
MYYIFEVTAKAGHSIDEYAASWMEASALIQRSYGAQGTRLHRKIGDDRRALAIATWESKVARDAASLMGGDAVKAIIEAQSGIVTVEFIGEFEAPDWEVLPTIE